MRLKRSNDPKGKRSWVGRKYFNEFDTCFWKLPGKYE